MMSVRREPRDGNHAGPGRFFFIGIIQEMPFFLDFSGAICPVVKLHSHPACGARERPIHAAGRTMKTKTKIWLGIGAFVVAGSNAAAMPDATAEVLHDSSALSDTGADGAMSHVAPDTVMAQHQHVAATAKAKAPAQGGEGAEGGGERGAA